MLPLQLRKSNDAGNVSGVSLHGDLERPLCEAVKVKPGLPWRDSQDVGEAEAVGYLLRKMLMRSGTSPKESVC